jgi:glycosyltransferase involved in cell wall biosynthesis
MAHAPAGLHLLVAGTGTQAAALQALAVELGVDSRVRFLGAVSDDDVIDLYAGALGVIFAPYDEDFGYVTLEAFLSRKPVITTVDAGGPNEFVLDGINGYVRDPSPEAVADAIARLDADRGRSAAMGDAGYARAKAVTWAGVVEKLVQA